MSAAVPQRLRELDPETILWLDRLDSKQREALIWAGRLDPLRRERLDKFLDLNEDHFEAGFAVVQLWTRLRWLGSTSMWIILTVAGLLLALTQIVDQLKGPKP
ncbi:MULTISPECIES: hypothetical protein [unclassified Mesorhizobium]|uniref:hypothetical protein n=1 Tax=unclassified Mesorhizobium TaxID=325217 RepID=UPI000BB02BCC|nr:MULTISPECIES: hypothetical protein [unclassified Mesorhizobium]TGV90128.1 hypothetical protein EN801_020990 [Mesorhizobium sp. M00.F.Ca.ET.158.01.1.1]MDG4853793.1 hypothetical protein [Mesorhizobium sp. WSM4982]MDG4887704.1 hypothetical protein [Mesorhizobium sp. WSM4887]MDG4915638.1 hypothetical protein [Mesorhizobium sp. WSM4983]PBB29810.1 hypothetical protein CK214_23875 [Mesorhizobium sp. WSM3882]